MKKTKPIWGGRRAGSGRKPTGPEAGVPHRRRPQHTGRHPLHVTLRVAAGLPSLRGSATRAAVKTALAAATNDKFRVMHSAVRRDQVHLIVKAANRKGVSRGLQGLSIRVARAVNAILGRSGSLWGDRYQARALKTPRELRDARASVVDD